MTSGYAGGLRLVWWVVGLTGVVVCACVLGWLEVSFGEMWFLWGALVGMLGCCRSWMV